MGRNGGRGVGRKEGVGPRGKRNPSCTLAGHAKQKCTFLVSRSEVYLRGALAEGLSGGGERSFPDGGALGRIRGTGA